MTTSELKHFEKKVLHSHKRASLKRLYAYLKKHQKVDKEMAFFKTFNAQYTTKKDALFRNELRLLNRELELFMVEEVWRKNLRINSDETQLSLMTIYLERKEFSLFEQIWKKLYKKAVAESLYSLKVKLINLFFSYKTASSEVNTALYEELKLLTEEALKATVAQMEIDYKELELKDAFIQGNLYALSGQKYDFRRGPHYYKRENYLDSDTLVDFLDYRIQSYFLSGTEKINILQKALACAEPLLAQYPKHPTLKHSITMVEITVGLEYFLLKEYQKADELYVRALNKAQMLSTPKKAAVYFNYISNLICLEAYNRAIEWYESNEGAWKKVPQVMYRIQYMLCWAYVMQGEYQKPMDMLLEHNIQQRPENDFVYARLLLTILYYSRNELELAEREAYNLIQNHRYKTPREEVFIAYSKLIYQHIQAIYIVDEGKQKEKLTEIQEKLDALFQNNFSSASTMMYRWLNRQNEQALTKRGGENENEPPFP
ncbi:MULTISPECIES: hypothetical protein [unclassified Aureispira]|uniref:hypothetical protein n=1 Tax=unclassified Aureispira TaxID=2649989 RepID=UPI000698CEA3|nr:MULTISPECIES: hypothetical protein [unclassified Aureispira]WMX15133.1 hypothetical protein QP953_01960 [Aureispira sp. CCB-E]